MYKTALIESKYNELVWNLKKLYNVSCFETNGEKSFVLSKNNIYVEAVLQEDAIYVTVEKYNGEDYIELVKPKYYVTSRPAYNYINRVLAMC